MNLVLESKVDPCGRRSGETKRTDWRAESGALNGEQAQVSGGCASAYAGLECVNGECRPSRREVLDRDLGEAPPPRTSRALGRSEVRRGGGEREGEPAVMIASALVKVFNVRDGWCEEGGQESLH